jgi:hypothetical protein
MVKEKEKKFELKPEPKAEPRAEPKPEPKKQPLKVVYSENEVAAAITAIDTATGYGAVIADNYIGNGTLNYVYVDAMKKLARHNTTNSNHS